MKLTSERSPVLRPIGPDDITRLSSLFKNTTASLIQPNDPTYMESITTWAATSVKPAGLVVQPTTTEEVARAVKFATDNGIELAIRCGGHSTSGSSGTNGGLLVHLRRMNKVTVEDLPDVPGQKAFRVQGGANWGEVDAVGAEHGIYTTAGTVADTGVGGLTLGGGLGWLIGKHGLVIDNMVEATVVISSGEVLHCTLDKNADLFWALRGAGQNFGVVTEMVLKAYPHDKVWGGMLFFPPDPSIMTKAISIINDKFQIGPDGRTSHQAKTMGGMGFLSPPPANGAVMFFFSLFYDGPEADGRAYWKDLLDLGPIIEQMSMITMQEANKLVAPPPGHRVSLKGAAFHLPLRPDFFLEVYKAYESLVTRIPDALSTIIMLELYDPHELVARGHASTDGGGCFAARGYHLNALVGPMWSDPANDAVCRQWARDVAATFKAEMARSRCTGEANVTAEQLAGPSTSAPRRPGEPVMVYGNYDQDYFSSSELFGDSYEHLRKLKARFDPKGMFNKMFPIEPLK